MDWLDDFLSEASDFIVGPFLLIPLLLATGIYLTVLLRGLQVRQLFPALRLALIQRKEPDGKGEGDISHYQALTTALAATIGIGNIAGVATAFYLGGPGSLFWMWITGLFGMATKYSEAFLGVRFRRKDATGRMSGGPMHYLRQGIPGRLGVFLSVFFAAAGAIAAFGIGNGTQANTVATSADSEWGVPTWVTGVILTIGAAVVILGGIKVIGQVTAAFVPLMAVLYVLGCVTVIAANIGELPSAISLVVSDAFTGTSAAGGFAGAAVMEAIRWGVARGIFSNESGLGTGGIAAAAAQSSHPARQGLVSMTQTFLDTLVVVSFTGLTIVVTGVWDDPGVEEGAPMTIAAFQEGLGDWASHVVVISIIFFAASTIIGWGYYGDRCVESLWGVRAIMPYRVLFVAMVYVGSVSNLQTIWLFSDVANGLMALPNLIGLLILSRLVVRETRAYLRDPQREIERAQKDL
ncbi:sodium:alanine symporter family protein [Streptomyces sp. 7-21]|jgi:AGCS family alanine or glycine:cation symporter|uniref:alanine/glycine:cation symporter family protein n=1 Tax=Streptomyces sp. 7-21 TaxID=2802283 RepID=UPI00191F48FB|nr:sodium:alanine symporter family protein [Streptomyces sp. 7-21]MBL1066867.1 sodium:alanine symporter family protein [Streptomyces sp. 7-21]